MQKIIQFIKEVREEFKNISWPKKDALVQLTVAVVAISIIISLILGGFDYLFTSSFGYFASGKSNASTQAIPTIEVIPTGLETPSPTIILKTTPNSKK